MDSPPRVRRGRREVGSLNLLTGNKMMRFPRLWRSLTLFTSSAVLFQFAGCNTSDAFDFVQTILLGITAAGAVAILQNV